jgi:hypothetical protein
MGERSHSSSHSTAGDVRAPQRASTPPVRRATPTTQTRALALQRTIGNRAATRVLSRWAAHPDKDKKGVLMTDEMAAEYTRFNPPLSK